MISSLKGFVRALSRENQLTLNVGGVGYEIQLPHFVYQKFVRNGVGVGDELELEIYYHAAERQPRPMLVGFENGYQKAFFERIITVKGIGPTKAIALETRPEDIVLAIEAGDVDALTRMKGIGKSAAKIVAELQDKLDLPPQPRGADAGDPERAPPTRSRVRVEAIQALITLGYRNSEATQVVNAVLATNPDAADSAQTVIKEAFRLKQKADAGQ